VSSCRLTWARRSWGGSLLDFWDDFSDDGQLDEPAEGARVPTGSLVVTRTLPAGASAEMTFVIAWHFPNRRGWSHTAAGPSNFSHSDDIVGNHYATLFADAADVVRRLASRLPDLERRTIDYVRTVTGSDLPVCVQDAVLSSVAVLKSTTCFRIADGGTFLGWEGSPTMAAATAAAPTCGTTSTPSSSSSPTSPGRCVASSWSTRSTSAA